MRRVWPFQLLLTVLAFSAAGLVWLTHHPEAPILERASAWPVVGPLAGEIRRLYLPPSEEPRPSESSSSEAHTPAEVVGRHDAPGEEGSEVGAFEARPFEWFKAGTPVFEAPSRDSTLLLRLDNLARFGLFERRGEWARVRLGSRQGWIQVNHETVSEDPPLGRAPTPVTPVPGRPPEAHRLQSAQDLLQPPLSEGRLGPYRLITDFRDEELLDFLDGVARHHEGAHRRRYGLPALGSPAAVVVLFSRERDYRRFQEMEEGLEGLRAAGHAGSGIVALPAQARPREITASVLAHELTHMVNRRTIGPALPPWLEEGLAEDLGGSRFDAGGRILPDTVQESIARTGLEVRVTGFKASLVLLRQALEAGRVVPVSKLLAMGWQDFVSSGRLSLHYAESAMLVRFLLTPENGYSENFLSFLAGVSRGEPATGEVLLERLGIDGRRLDSGFQAWLRLRLAELS